MLRLNVLSGTTVLTIFGAAGPPGRPAFPKNPFSGPERTQKPGMRRPTSADRTGSASKTASPRPLKSPMLRRKAGDDGGVQRTRVKHRNNQQQNTKR